MHEQSETIQGPNGRWINVYGRKVKGKAGTQLPGTKSYATMEEAVAEAKRRSEEEGFAELVREAYRKNGVGR